VNLGPFVVAAFVALSSKTASPQVLPTPLDAGIEAGANLREDAGAPPLFRLDIGGVTPVQPSQVSGYGIVALSARSYRIVWTGDAGRGGAGSRRFVGSLVTRGQFVRLLPGCASNACELEPGDVVTKTRLPHGERIDWASITLDELDGFDVDISPDAEPLDVDATIDSARRPAMMYFRSNGTATSPKLVPFQVTTRLH